MPKRTLESDRDDGDGPVTIPGFTTHMNFYLYRSRAKIDMLYSQVKSPDKKKKITWKLTTKYVSRESGTETSPETTLEDKLQAVLRELEGQELIGEIENQKPYIKTILPMRWGLYDDEGYRAPETGPMVYFGATTDELLFGLGGSSHHIEGYYGITSTGSRSATPYLANFLVNGLANGEPPPDYQDVHRGQMDVLYEAMALANHYLRGPVQNLEFVAKVICRNTEVKVRPWRPERGEGILATPLYVSQIDPMSEDQDPPFKGQSAD